MFLEFPKTGFKKPSYIRFQNRLLLCVNRWLQKINKTKASAIGCIDNIRKMFLGGLVFLLEQHNLKIVTVIYHNFFISFSLIPSENQNHLKLRSDNRD